MADKYALSDGVTPNSPIGEQRSAPPPRLLDQVRATVRARHYSRRTEKAYVAWIRRFILFHGKRHPRAMGPDEITRYLSSLATNGHVAASTQNQAIARPASTDVITLTSPSCNAQSKTPCVTPGSRSAQRATRYVTPSQPISSRTTATSEPSRSSSVTAISARP